MTDIVLWRRIDLPGHEIGRVDSHEEGWTLAGTAVFAHDGRPCRLDYEVTCDTEWRTTSAGVAGAIGVRPVDLTVSVDRRGRWRLNNEVCEAVEGCIDIDLGFSPSTNLLPIRRLGLAVGEAAEVQAAWLPFPALAFEPLAQTYQREGETTYRYESGGGRFVRTLEVNPTGLVIDYPGLWEIEEPHA
jgi:hypothetical protein